MILVALHKSHNKHNKLALIPFQNKIIFIFFFSSSSTFKPFVFWQHSNGTRTLEKQLMTVMMKEERCANNGLLLIRKKKKPSNILQRLGFNCSEKTKAF
jgi:hypothetical protein